MTRIITKMGDRLLSLFAGRTEAGACVAEYGQTFWVYGCATCSCYTKWVRKDCQYRYNCYGSTSLISTKCVSTSSLC